MHLDKELRFHYQDSYVIGFYRDKTSCIRLLGLLILTDLIIMTNSIHHDSFKIGPKC